MLPKHMIGTMEHDVISRLMSGNDTQCFTTEQYETYRDEWITAVAGATREELGLKRSSLESVRNQLIQSEMVVEVGDNLWTSKQDS